MDNTPWYELLDRLIGREGFSRPQVAQRANVKTKTITSWLRGDVKSPRRWQPLARVLQALNASSSISERIFHGAGFPSIHHLARQANDREKELLAFWLLPEAPFMSPDRLVTILVGRSEELVLASDALNRRRRCILVGMGGVGKTTLAIELAHRLSSDFPDGVFWGDISTAGADAILESWGQACGVTMDRLTDFNSRAAFLRGVFSRKKALIILDDVVDSQQALQMMPSQHLGCAVLVTTRSEDVANSLARRQANQTVRLRPITRQQSLTLFSEMLGEETVVRESRAADKVATLLGDLPLALHICGALCTDTELTLTQMAVLLAELRTRLEHLRLEQKPLVRLAFEQSWTLLDEEMRYGLAVTAVFAGRPFTITDFAACMALDEPRTALLLTRLCRRSLLTVSKANDIMGRDRSQYRQHALLAAYAAEKLADADPAWQRFSNHYCQAIREDRWWRMIAHNVWGHVMAGMETAHRLQKWSLVLDYWERLEEGWRRRGLYTLARQGCAWAYDAAQALANQEMVAKIRLHWGRACLEQSDYSTAQDYLTMALAQFEEKQDLAGVAEVHYQLSRIQLQQDDHPAAEASIQQAWHTYQQLEDVQGMGRSLYRLGNIVYHQGNYQRVISLVTDAIRSQQTSNDTLGLLRSHMLATSTYLQLQEISEAEHHCQIAARLVEQLNDPAETSIFYYVYADVLRKKQAFAEAHTYGHKALVLFREMMDRSSEANALLLLASNEVDWNETEPRRQQIEEGLAYCHAGQDICTAIGYDVGKAFLLWTQGRLLAKSGDNESACAVWVQALELAQAVPHEWLQQRLQALINENCPVTNLLPSRPLARSQDL